MAPRRQLHGPSSRRIALWPLDRLRPYQRNPRMHSEDQVDEIAASIVEFGFLNPILVDTEAGIIAGHGRLLAARRLGLEQVPVLVLDHLTPIQRRAYVIADNRLAERASWDKTLLTEELRALLDDDFELPVLGFSNEELEAFLGAEIHGEIGEVDPDLVPEPPDDPVTRPGDLWILGDHRLLCGDSGKPEDVDRLLAGERIHLVNTDPPYNVRVEPRSNNAVAAGLSSFPAAASKTRGSKHHQSLDLARHPEKAKPTGKMRAKDRPLENDFVSDEAFDQMLLAWFGNISRVLLPGRAFYIWGGYANCANYPPVLKATGLYFSQSIIWVKEHPVLTRKDYMGNHEWAFYGWREGAAHYFQPDIHNATDVWVVKKINPQSMVHLTEKPVELAVRAMTYSSRPGENVLDLFGGSGSTLIGAQQTGRRAFLMEIDPAYCDVIVKRFEAFTGTPARREE
ncbi:MAG: site-specific DNA-methyltransferase [Candidatus Eisenbacteria bacterium]|nr:site-specific DNA-methyltransferase [Candidatus Eisenbacteria bacterium]